MARTQTQLKHTLRPSPVQAPVRAQTQTRAVQVRQLGRYLFVVPALIYIALTTVYPVFSNLRTSLYDVNVSTFLANNAPFVGFDNYAKVLGDPAFQHAITLSLLFTAGSLVFQFTIGF